MQGYGSRYAEKANATSSRDPASTWLTQVSQSAQSGALHRRSFVPVMNSSNFPNRRATIKAAAARNRMSRAGSEQIFQPHHSNGVLPKTSGGVAWNQLNAFFQTIEPARRVLPTEDEMQEELLPPSVGELEMQRACFSTATVPWLGRRKAPKDDNLEVLVKALMTAVKETQHATPVHVFSMLHNPHRENHNFTKELVLSDQQNAAVAENKLRRRVLLALERFPLCSVGDLVSCDADTWRSISQSLGGLNHALAVRSTQNLLISNQVRPVDRAIYHAASGRSQRPVDRGRKMYV